MRTVPEVDTLIAKMPTPHKVGLLPLLQAHGKILAQNVVAERDQPPFDRVAMDGIAIHAADFSPNKALQGRYLTKIVAIQAAGHPQLDLQTYGEQPFPLAIEVMTGAPLPKGCDVVLPYERLDVKENFASFATNEELTLMRNVHRQAADYAAHVELLEPGILLDPPRLALLASQGLASVRVRAPLKIAIISTGDELVPPGEPLLPHQIRSSNDVVMAALLEGANIDVSEMKMHHLKDEESAVVAKLQALLEECDVVILSGGVSKGKFDFIPDALAKLGVEKSFHRVKQKPGKPFWAGVGPKEQLVFALPGNPVATMVSMRRYVVPKLLECTGQKPMPILTVQMLTGGEFQSPLTRFLQVSLQEDKDGTWLATPISSNGSGDFASAARGDGFIEVPLSVSHFQTGDHFAFYAWTR